MRQGKAPIIYGNGEQTRDFIHVQDVAKIIHSMVNAGISFQFSEANVCSGERYSLLDLVNCMNQLLIEKGIINNPIKPEFKSARDGDIIDSQGDNHRIKTILGMSIRRNFIQGISEIIDCNYNQRDSR